MSGFELTSEFNEKREMLDIAIRELKKRGQRKAKAEQEYRVLQAKKIYELRSDGIPVTIISDLCKGNEEIASLRMERDLTKTLYETALQKIYQLKLEIGIIQKQIEREYSE